MNIEELLVQSRQLLGLGMGAVFIILISLIGLITIVSKLVPGEVEPAKAPTPLGIDPNHVAAISTALHQHRKSR